MKTDTLDALILGLLGSVLALPMFLFLVYFLKEWPLHTILGLSIGGNVAFVVFFLNERTGHD